jgi:hypothetical protein
MTTTTADDPSICPGCGRALEVACPDCRGTARPAASRTRQRTDLVTALLVDAVISASAAEGTAYAARTLCENGVPFDVALRVLTRPWNRRYHPVTHAYAAPPRAGMAAASASGVADPRRTVAMLEVADR